MTSDRIAAHDSDPYRDNSVTENPDASKIQSLRTARVSHCIVTVAERKTARRRAAADLITSEMMPSALSGAEGF